MATGTTLAHLLESGRHGDVAERIQRDLDPHPESALALLALQRRDEALGLAAAADLGAIDWGRRWVAAYLDELSLGHTLLLALSDVDGEALAADPVAAESLVSVRLARAGRQSRTGHFLARCGTPLATFLLSPSPSLERSLSKNLANESGYPRAIRVAEALVELGRPEAGAEAVEILRSGFPASEGAPLLRADHQLRRGRIDEAEAILAGLLPDDWRVALLRCRSTYQRGDPKLAVRRVHALWRSQPWNGTLYRWNLVLRGRVPGVLAGLRTYMLAGAAATREVTRWWFPVGQE